MVHHVTPAGTECLPPIEYMPDFPGLNAGSAAFLQQVHRLPHRKVRKFWNSDIVFVRNELG